MTAPGPLGQGHESSSQADGCQQPSTRSYQTGMSVQPSQLRVLAVNRACDSLEKVMNLPGPFCQGNESGSQADGCQQGSPESPAVSLS